MAKSEAAVADDKPAETSSRDEQGSSSRSKSKRGGGGGGGGDGKQGSAPVQQQQQQQGGGQNRRNKKRKKKRGRSQSRPSIPQSALPSEEDLDREAQELEQALSPKKYKEEKAKALHISQLQSMGIEELHALAEKEGLEDFHQIHAQELIFNILRARAESGGLVIGSGTLEVLPEGYGFLRSPEHSYLAGPDDVYVAPSLIRKLGLKKGHVVKGPVRAPQNSERYFALVRADEVNGQEPEAIRDLTTFEDLTPLHPEERFVLETEPDVIETRVIDLVSPIGKGQRGLIVAPPRTGKTILLQKMTNAISKNYPDVKVLVLLIDERPEEVTDFRRNTPEGVEVVASTFDERSSRHTQVAEMVIEKARRAVESGEHVVILLDSITRLARAYNNEMPHSGKIMTGGIDSGALQKPKKFFGAARAIENGGSLTILATALVDTGSKADEVIFEEFKGTGNSELHLDRRLVEKRIWPAIDIAASGTRREELLLDPKELELVYRLRKVLSDMNVVEAMELLKSRLAKSKSNAEFLMTMNLG